MARYIETMKELIESINTETETLKQSLTKVDEKLDPKDDAGVWIKDFIDSTDSKFEGKSKDERKEMALAAWYAARKEAGIKEDVDNGEEEDDDDSEEKEVNVKVNVNTDDDDDSEEEEEETDESIRFIDALVAEEVIAEGDKEAYQKFFKEKLAKYNVKSPSELSDTDKKKFFDEIKKEWKK